MMVALLVCAIPASADTETAVVPLTIETINPDGASAGLSKQAVWTSPLYNGDTLISEESRGLLDLSVNLSFKERDDNSPDNRVYVLVDTGDYKFTLKWQRRTFGKTDGSGRLQITVKYGYDGASEVGEWYNSNSHHNFQLSVKSTYDETANKTTVTIILYDLEEPADENGVPYVQRTWVEEFEGKKDSPLKQFKVWTFNEDRHDTGSNTWHAFYCENMKLNGVLDANLNNASYWEYDEDYAIHTYSDYVTTQEANCGQDGYATRTCSICQATMTKKTGSATYEHSYGEAEIVTPAGCLTAGKQKQVCSVCGDVYEKAIKATGHTEATEYTVDVQPTTTTVGSKSKHCTVCDAIIEGTEVEIPVVEETTTTEAPTTKADEGTTEKTGCGSTLGVSALALVLVSTLGMGLKRKH